MTLRPVPKYHCYRGNERTTDALVEPVTAAELRTQLRTDSTNLPDSEAENLVKMARVYLEDMTSLAMIDQTWTLTLDEWPQRLDGVWWDGIRDGAISELYNPANLSSVFLPRFPLDSITSVTVYDEASNATAVTIADTFDIDTYQKPGRMTLKRGATWPVAMRANNAVVVVYVAGYGPAASDVPLPVKQAVLLMAVGLYANRGDGCDMGQLYKTSGAELMLSPYVTVSI